MTIDHKVPRTESKSREVSTNPVSIAVIAAFCPATVLLPRTSGCVRGVPHQPTHLSTVSTNSDSKPLASPETTISCSLPGNPGVPSVLATHKGSNQCINLSVSTQFHLPAWPSCSSYSLQAPRRVVSYLPGMSVFRPPSNILAVVAR